MITKIANTGTGFFLFLVDTFRNRRIIASLVYHDIKQRFSGNYLGVLWAFIGPTIQISILWFVFQVGFKAAPVQDVPFFVWLAAGFFPWIFITEIIGSGTGSIVEKSYLVKKIVFRVSVLPIVKIISALIIHMFFLVFLFGILLWYKIVPTVTVLQLLYYIFATMVLGLGISWITASVAVFARDVNQIVAVILQFGFWLTPVFWSAAIIPPKYHTLIKLNPAYYIVEGYRDSLINHVWFWQRLDSTVYFWVTTLCLFVLGAFVFKRLKPHFADVL